MFNFWKDGQCHSCKMPVIYDFMYTKDGFHYCTYCSSIEFGNNLTISQEKLRTDIKNKKYEIDELVNNYNQNKEL